MSTKWPLLTALILLVLAACSGGASGSSATVPVPTSSPTPGPTLGPASLKLALMEAHGPLWYCDPDFYPVARGEEIDHARERWSEVVADADAFAAIAKKLGFDPAADFTDSQKLGVYQVWKTLAAVALDPIGNNTFRFDYLAEPKPGAARGTRTAGTITATGVIKIDQQADADEPICPICLARGTLIETPEGPLPVEDIEVGDPVWTLDAGGRRVVGAVLVVGSTEAPVNHHVVHLTLADGRTVTASPGHPLADGLRLGDLRVGDPVDGSFVASARLIPYTGDRTFDLIVSGSTGTYFVDGIPLGSTLR